MCCIRLFCHVFVMVGKLPAAGIIPSSLSFGHKCSALLAFIIADKHHHVKQTQLESPPSGTEITQCVLPWFLALQSQSMICCYSIQQHFRFFPEHHHLFAPPRDLSDLIRSASEDCIAHYVIKTDFYSKSSYVSKNLSRLLPEDG